MEILKAFRFRIYPTSDQESLFWRTLGSCRFLYNLCLDQRNLEYHRSKPRRLTSFDQSNELSDLKEELPWLREVPHHALQQTIKDLDKAFRRFFEGKGGYPKFKKRNAKSSFRYPDPKQFKLRPGAIFLPKAGWVKLVQHRALEGVIKTATISADAGAWYVSIQCKVKIDQPLAASTSVVGIDFGVNKPLTLTTGEVIMLPRTSKAEWEHLARLQRRLDRKDEGSKNREKARRKLARYYAYLTRRRLDAAHKATTYIAKNHGVIVIEDLKIKNMTASAAGTVDDPGKDVAQKSGLNRSILDVAPYQIRSMLAYKCHWYGSELKTTPAPYTSQRCYICRHVAAVNRKKSVFLCVACGNDDDADFNASDNIRAGGLPVIAYASTRNTNEFVRC